MATVKCKNCGWLGVRVRLTRNLVDADEAYRERGYVPTTGVGNGTEAIFDSLPVCFANKRDFYDEFKKPTPSEDQVGAALKLDYPCDSLIPWQAGITPKELQDMLMLEEQRKALKTEAVEQRQFRDNEAKRNQRWRIIELLVMGGIVTVISVLSQLGAAFIERGTAFPPPAPAASPPFPTTNGD